MDDLAAALSDLWAGARILQESLCKAIPGAAVGRCFMNQFSELGDKHGAYDELTLDGFQQEVHAFVRRVAGSTCSGPEAETKGNLTLLACVVEGILAQAAEWESSLAPALMVSCSRCGGSVWA